MSNKMQPPSILSLFKRPPSLDTAPGSLVPIRAEEQQPAQITLYRYQPDQPLEERTLTTIEAADVHPRSKTVTWLQVQGTCAHDTFEKMGKIFGLHPLTMEDILDRGQRPKMEEFEDYLFIELNEVLFPPEAPRIAINQISIILKKNLVITFQEYPTTVFDTVIKRLREGKTKLVKQGADYLVYSLMDAVVDHYYLNLEDIGDRIEDLEESTVTNPDPDLLQEIHLLKSELILYRKSIWPLREVISSLERGDSSFIKPATLVYLRDIYDHIIQVIESTEIFREIVSGILDIYLTSVSNKMNQVMKVLTVVTSIFIPITFITGLYGMNFENMPELHWRWGYFAVLGVIALLVIGMLAYFRRRKWL
ncbi:MAG: magnesium/cobalt transporter CorA [Anaerolineae bacterium]|jgi:magnesium transporter|nr:magnesium/cobalt transporter CorA [Anaerolineae bacterium]